eukprot:gene4097-biopygen3608
MARAGTRPRSISFLGVKKRFARGPAQGAHSRAAQRPLDCEGWTARTLPTAVGTQPIRADSGGKLHIEGTTQLRPPASGEQGFKKGPACIKRPEILEGEGWRGAADTERLARRVAAGTRCILCAGRARRPRCGAQSTTAPGGALPGGPLRGPAPRRVAVRGEEVARPRAWRGISYGCPPAASVCVALRPGVPLLVGLGRAAPPLLPAADAAERPRSPGLRRGDAKRDVTLTRSHELLCL